MSMSWNRRILAFGVDDPEEAEPFRLGSHGLLDAVIQPGENSRPLFQSVHSAYHY
jgi:hypothetical protein